MVPAAIIAIDHDVHEDASLFSLVEALAIVEWNTLRNVHVNRPRELLRSIIVDALSDTTTANAEAAGVVWNTVSSRLRHRQTRLGTAANVVTTILKQASETTEAEAVTRAALVAPTSKIPRTKKPSSKNVSRSLSSAIKESEVVTDVIHAAGPGTDQDIDLEDPNPYWSNDAPSWSYEFAPRMALAMAEAVNLGTARLAESIGKKLPDLLLAHEKQLFDQLHEIEVLQSEMSQYHKASRMRLDVLWWSESLYSPSLQVGYRELPLPVAAVAAAMDLVGIVPPLAPASVCYVLFETVLRIATILDANENQSIIRYLDILSSSKVDHRVEISYSPTDDLCVPLLCLVGEACTGGRPSSEDLRLRAGIDGTIKLSAAEFAMWIFRDLQARRLVDKLR